MYDFFSPYREIIPDFDDFIDSLNRPFPVHLRLNRIKAEPEKVINILKERGISLKLMAMRATAFLRPLT
jgi:16S rRNA C967 or C1407 C5-methylase (RsmB/RsmF family)